MHRFTKLLFALIAAGCAAKTETVRTEPPALQLAANQLVIGERITFHGADGKPVVTRPGVYRVGVRGNDKLELYFSNAEKPRLVRAKKKRVTLTAGQRGALQEPKALLRVPNESGTRELWLCLPDGTAYGAVGVPDGVRLRGNLLVQTAPSELAPVYTTAGATFNQDLLLKIASPNDNEVYWNRREPLRVTWTGGSGTCSVSFVHRMTLRSMVSETVMRGSSVDFHGMPMYHLDPGRYEVVVQDLVTGDSDSRRVRVVGAVRSVAGVPGGPDTRSALWVDAAPEGRDNPKYWPGSVFALGPDSGQSEQHDDYIYWRVSHHFGGAGNEPRPLPSSPSIGVRARALAVGSHHAVAISPEGGAMAWGAAYPGGLMGPVDIGEHAQSLTPLLVGAPLDKGVIQVATCGFASYALTEDGSVYSWGPRSPYFCAGVGELGNPDAPYGTVVRVLKAPNQPLTDIVAIVAGWFHGLALDSKGRLWGWGELAEQPLGDDDFVHIESGTPSLRMGSYAVRLWKDWNQKIVAVDSVGNTCFALVQRADGSLETFVWGSGGFTPDLPNDGGDDDVPVVAPPASIGQVGLHLSNLSCLRAAKPRTHFRLNAPVRQFDHDLIVIDGDIALCWAEDRILLMQYVDRGDGVFEPAYFPFR